MKRALALIAVVGLWSLLLAAEESEYEVPLEGIGAEISIVRHIERDTLPFAMSYSVLNAEVLSDYQLIWDTDKYVDSDSDGVTTSDQDCEGTSIELEFDENFNPSITLRVVDLTRQTVATWEDALLNNFDVGSEVLLDGAALLATGGIDVSRVSDVSWSQVHMGMSELEYMTEHDATIRNSRSVQAFATHGDAGRYVYEFCYLLDGVEHTKRVAAWVIEELGVSKPVGFMMFDLWNECYSEARDEMSNCGEPFTDREALAKLEWLSQEGFEYIDLMNQFAMESTVPTPQIVDKGWISYMDDADLSMLFEKIACGQLSWQTYHFGDPSVVDVRYWHDFENRDLTYYMEFFRQYTPALESKAALAEELGLESFIFGFQHPYLHGLCSLYDLNQHSAEWVADQWLQALERVDAVYSGRIGLGVPGYCDLTRNIASEADFLFESLGAFRGYEIQHTESIGELRTSYADYLDDVVLAIGREFGLPIRFSFWAYTYDGSSVTAWTPTTEADVYSTWEPIMLWESEDVWSERAREIFAKGANPEYLIDFAEQVRAVEAWMPLLACEDKIEAIYSQYEYWKLMDYSDFFPRNSIDYGSLFWGSLQGKPAYYAYKLWASMLSSNPALQYRRASPIPEISRDGEPSVEDIDWSMLPDSMTFDASSPPSFGSSNKADARLGATWQTDSVSVVLLPEGLALEIRFADGAGASRDPYVQYVIALGSSTRIHVIPGSAVVLLFGSGGNVGEIWQPGHELAQVTHDTLRILIPDNVVEEHLSSMAYLSSRNVSYSIKYTGDNPHSYVNYPAIGSVWDLR